MSSNKRLRYDALKPPLPAADPLRIVSFGDFHARVAKRSRNVFELHASKQRTDSGGSSHSSQSQLHPKNIFSDYPRGLGAVFVALRWRALGLVGDIAGSAAYVSLCPPRSRDSFIALSIATIVAPPGGTRHCNTALPPDTVENGAHIPSIDTNVFVDGGSAMGHLPDSWLTV